MSKAQKNLVLGIGSMIGSIALGGIYRQFQQKEEEKEEKEEDPSCEREPYKLLDPFVQAYDTSHDFGEQFETIIREKMTVDEVKQLRAVLVKRKEALNLGNVKFAYDRLLEIVDKVLPLAGSLEDLGINDPHAFTFGTLGEGRSFPFSQPSKFEAVCPSVSRASKGEIYEQYVATGGECSFEDFFEKKSKKLSS